LTIFQKLDRSAIKVYLSLEFAFRDNSDDAFAKIFTRAIPRTALATPSLEKSRLLVKKTCRERKSQIRVRQTQSAFHRHAQQNAFRRRDARQQRRVFARRDPPLRHSPNSSLFAACFVTRGHLETAREGNTPSKLHFGSTVTTESSSRKTALGGWGPLAPIAWLGVTGFCHG
jgi:hypothetical protein